MSFQSKSRKIAVIRNIFIYTDFSYFTHACYLPHALFLLTGIFLPNVIPPDSHVLCVCVTHWGLLQLPVQTWVVSWRMGTYEWPHLWRKWLPLLRQSLTATVPQEEWDCVSAFPFCDEMLTCPICTGLMPITNSAPIPYSWLFSYVSLHWLLSETIRDFSEEDWQRYWSVGINMSI